MKPKITLKKIAKEFGVSISTVSKALKDSHEISEETKERIKAFAKFYHYKPNSLALRLRSQKNMVIGIVIPEIVHHFFSTVIRGIEYVCNEKGYNVMICVSNESHQKEVLNLEMFSNGSVDGVILSIARETQESNDYHHLNDLIEDDFPIVLFDRINDNLKCDKVVIDDVGGAFNATKHLIEIGRKRIAILTTFDFITVGALRKEGYIKALKKYNIKVDEDLIVKIDENKDIYEQIDKVISRPNPPDAILAVNEIYAAIAMKKAKEKGLRIPEDIAIAGFTDGLISEFSSPPLTSVMQHGFTMGKEAANLLIDRIENVSKLDFKKEIISTTLKIRQSTKNI